ncbi:MAG: carboxypeptidase regulatory-like domain-containing protein [Deltaproteobacteria bacterium]|nr:carboxypeptidase regulatory-like domain-containing protein [Deltaproteobacteria bacterium]
MSCTSGMRVLVLVAVVASVACENTPEDVPDSGPGADAGADASGDAGADAGCVGDACAGDSGGGIINPPWIDLTPTDPYLGPVVGRVAGRIRDMAGDPLPGMIVTLDSGGMAVSDADGIYAIDDVAPGSYIAHFTGTGYLSIHRSVTVDGWERVLLNAMLKAASPPQPFDSTAGATMRSGDVFVTVPAGAFVDGAGAAVAGMADVSITPVDPTTADLEAAPGDYVGNDGGSMSPLFSYGMAEITFSQGGAELQLAPGQTAHVEIPVPALGPEMPPVTLGDTMPLWWFDPAQATWVRDGTATAGPSGDGSGRMVFGADVTHFTPWNCDQPTIPTCVQGRVVDCAGFPVSGAEIVMTGPGVTSLARTRTDADGRYSVTGAARGEVVVEVRVSMGAQTFIAQTPPISTPTSACVSADQLSLTDIRYVGGMIDVWGSSFTSMDGTADTANLAASAIFWDLDDVNMPTIVSCTPPTPNDMLVNVPVPVMGTAVAVDGQDVGNPILLESSDVMIPIYRRNAEAPTADLVNTYTTVREVGMPTMAMGGVFDVSIPGAVATVPFTERPAALRVPETLVVDVPPAEMRTYSASSGIPVRWDGAAGDAVVTVTVVPMGTGGTGEILHGNVLDDGLFELTGPMLESMGDAATVVVTRSIEEFESLPTGPSVMLRGSSSVSFDIRRE